MVQILKQDKKEKLLEAASLAFLEQDFLKVSMRELSRLSGLSLGNLYNYFADKDTLFEAILTPTLVELDEFKKKLKKKDPMFLKFDKAEAYFDNIVDFLAKHKNNLKLLAFKSTGSKFENYIQDWVEVYAKYEYFSLRQKAKGHKEIFRKLPSELFIKSLCEFFFKAMLELVNKDLEEEKIAKYLNEVFAFVYNGWDYYID